MRYCAGCGVRVSVKKAKRHSNCHDRYCRKMVGKKPARAQRLERLAKK